MLGLTFDNGSISGEYLVKEVFQIDMNRSKWVNLAVLYAMVVIYRLIFLVMIKVKETISMAERENGTKVIEAREVGNPYRDQAAGAKHVPVSPIGFGSIGRFN